MKLINYFDVNLALNIHDKIIKKSGGLSGIKDKGQLESVLQNIQNDIYYPVIYDKLTHLIFGVNKFHCFFDGNKRTRVC
jgi:death-on-curing protein